MICKLRISRWLVGAALIAAIDCVSVAAVEVALVSPAQAQFRDDRFPFLRPSRQGGFFGGFFGGGGGGEGSGGSSHQPYDNYEQAPVDNSRAPPPKKPDPKAEQATPTTSVVVLGDAMADWLAYGLEDTFSDLPEIAVVRKNKIHSGLLRYDPKGDLDWWHVARDILAPEKPNYVVMMLGVSDRQNIRERDLAKEADNKKKDKAQADKAGTDKDAQTKDQTDEQEQAIVTPDPPPGKRANGVIEFRSDQWAEIYSKRIDETIAALKSKGVPVFWVGLPSIRGTKSTADAAYLNDLYRARAERAGVIYIDIWDGFVDEAGKYSNFGPDYEGQTRRLRSSDGVFFTKSGALKLAHYVEREIRRYMNSRATPVALPTGPLAPVPDGKPAARPVAGPVVPLTTTPASSDELLGGASPSSPHGDPLAARVLVKGEPVPAPPGRADDFVLQRGNEGSAPQAATAPADALASAPADTPAPPPPPAAAPEKKTATPPKNSPSTKTTQNNAVKPKPQSSPRQDDVPRPPRGIFPSNGGNPFSLFR